MVTSVEHFSQVVASIYDAAVSPHGWEQALADTCRVLGAEGGGMLGGDTSFWAIQDAAMPEHVTTAYTEHYHRLDPVMPTLLNGPRGRIYVHAEVIAPYRRGEFYADWMRPNAIEDGLFVRLTDGPRSTSLIVHSPGDAGSLATTDRLRLFSRIVVHYQQALAMHGTLSAMHDRNADLSTALDSVRHGVLVLSSGRPDPRVQQCRSGTAALERRHRLP